MIPSELTDIFLKRKNLNRERGNQYISWLFQIVCVLIYFTSFSVLWSKFLGKSLKGSVWLFLGWKRLELLCCLSQACITFIIKIFKDKNMHLGSFNMWFHKLFVLRVLFCYKIINNTNLLDPTRCLCRKWNGWFMGKCPDSYLKDNSPIPVCHSSASAKEDILRHFFFLRGK